MEPGYIVFISVHCVFCAHLAQGATKALTAFGSVKRFSHPEFPPGQVFKDPEATRMDPDCAPP